MGLFKVIKKNKQILLYWVGITGEYKIDTYIIFQPGKMRPYTKQRGRINPTYQIHKD
jgi:hypothetical protein